MRVFVRNPETARLWGMPEMEYVDMSGLMPRMVRNVKVDNINVYYDEGLPLEDGKLIIRISAESFCNMKYRDIEISNIFVNGKRISKADIQTGILTERRI